MSNLFERPRNRMVVMLLASSAFILYKSGDIFLPYFWDEMAGYMSGVIYMLDHGISLLPSAVPAKLSYGHPLLVHCMMACIASVFGSSVAVMHISTLVFTFLLAYGIYLLAFSLTKKWEVAVFSFLLCLAQPLVIAQSTQVLLEVFLAMTFVYAIYFYTKKKYIMSMCFCVMSVLTKETGLVIAIAFMVQHILELVLNKNKKAFILLVALYSVPFIVFGSFLLIQKQTYGWYLNPVNVGKSKLDIGSILQKIWDYALEFTFIDQGRWALTVILILGMIIYGIKRSGTLNWKYDRNILLICVFCFGFVLFSSIADTLERYFLSLIVFTVILFSAVMVYFSRFYSLLPLLLLCLCIQINMLYLENDKKYTETDMGYRHLVKTNQALFDYINSGVFKGDTIGFSFPLQYAPLDARYGYFKERNFIPDTSFSPHSKYFIFSSPGNYESNTPDTLLLKRMVEFSSGYSKAFIYKKISF
jgi:hypothetical protein